MIKSKKKNPVDYAHCKDISSFIRNFTRLPEVQQIIIDGEDDEYGVNEAYGEFLQLLCEHLKNQPEFKDLNLKELNWVVDALEKYITKKIYDK